LVFGAIFDRYQRIIPSVDNQDSSVYRWPRRKSSRRNTAVELESEPRPPDCSKECGAPDCRSLLRDFPLKQQNRTLPRRCREKSAEQRRRDSEWDIRNDVVRSDRKNDAQDVGFNNLDRPIKGSTKMLCLARVEFNGRHGSFERDEITGDRAVACPELNDREWRRMAQDFRHLSRVSLVG
jgi:hypothetical protein